MFLKNQKYRTKIPTISLGKIAARMAKEIGDLRAKQIEIMLNWFFNEVVKELKKGNEVKIGNYGKFKMIKKDSFYYDPVLKDRKFIKGHIKVLWRPFTQMMEMLRKEEGKPTEDLDT